ncbi:purine permease 10 [Spatholobus suberectus]|nr:purine permease 10 [Spatholobus suberectus]
MDMEMKEFENGRVSYVMTLAWTAVTWQIAFIGMLGLIFEVSSLFSVVIGSLELTIAPILAVMVFHDKINGVKVIAFLLAIWGFLSYIYQHYLDDQKAKEDKSGGIEVSNGEYKLFSGFKLIPSTARHFRHDELTHRHRPPAPHIHCKATKLSTHPPPTVTAHRLHPSELT